jgi:transcriptional regulator with XRE-family HTH domain
VSRPTSPQAIALGRTVRRRRRDLDLSREALAGDAGISSKHLGEIERGMRDPRATTILRLLDALGMHPIEMAAFWTEVAESVEPRVR